MDSEVGLEEEMPSRGSMWDFDQKFDQPMEEEAGRLRNMYREKKFSSVLLLRLAFQSLGVVYGDLGTSPLYVFNNTFPKGIDDPEDVIGALSLIIYSLTLVPLLKYVFVVCRANDNGQGKLMPAEARLWCIVSVATKERWDVCTLFFTLSACQNEDYSEPASDRRGADHV
ncbi:hypothetical protein MLD38_019477 [Melastoma candidum]|uniref:Uncharacterized protein n=1 Tax=Melastoma candidum TaxID=119954 RepID=A0ACB9QX40_9MYRT|nr:hypothetical protein MLD38_019477 [Melastoma candidum]